MRTIENSSESALRFPAWQFRLVIAKRGRHTKLDYYTTYAPLCVQNISARLKKRLCLPAAIADRLVSKALYILQIISARDLLRAQRGSMGIKYLTIYQSALMPDEMLTKDP